jgi:NTP pyrophosphatase (non-canonical NTP hydrolase)
MDDLQDFALQFLTRAYTTDTLPPAWAQVLNVVGEAGEFGEAYRRYTGYARRQGNLDEVRLELADVVISAYVAAERLNIDLDDAIADKQCIIMNRGFTE